MDISNNFWLSVVIVPTIINIGTTILGIIATVFWIDRKIKEREELQWLPSQHFIYSKFIEISGNGLLYTLPTRGIKSSEDIYYFGNVSSPLKYEIRTDLEGLDLYADWEVELKILTPKEIERKIDRLTDILSEINAILTQSSYLLKPDFLSLILDARQKLEEIRSSKILLPTQENAEEIDSPDVLILTSELIMLATSFNNIQDWLIQKADKKETQKELEKRIFGNI